MLQRFGKLDRQIWSPVSTAFIKGGAAAFLGAPGGVLGAPNLPQLTSFWWDFWQFSTHSAHGFLAFDGLRPTTNCFSCNVLSSRRVIRGVWKPSSSIMGQFSWRGLSISLAPTKHFELHKSSWDITWSQLYDASKLIVKNGSAKKNRWSQPRLFWTLQRPRDRSTEVAERTEISRYQEKALLSSGYYLLDSICCRSLHILSKLCCQMFDKKSPRCERPATMSLGKMESPGSRISKTQQRRSGHIISAQRL